MTPPLGDRPAPPPGLAEALPSAFEQFPIALCTLEGPDHVFRAANGAYRALIGQESVVGRPLREVLASLEGQELLELVDRVAATGQAIVAGEQRVQLDPQDPSAERFLTFAISPWQDGDGSLRGMLVYVVDVTEEVVARRAAEAATAGAQARYEAAQEVVLTLQRSLLPESLPILPGARLAAQYVVAGEELRAGGDWFDAVPVEGGRVALVIGDVVGHGAEAAAAMAQLRPALEQALLAGAPVADAVDRLDAYAAHRPATRAATVCVALLDPATGDLEYVARAHPAPLVCAPDGGTRFLAGDNGGGPLGVGAGPSRPARATLAPGEVLLLYSDGLIERPGEQVRAGMDRLASAAGAAMTTRGRTTPEAPADRLVTLTLERLARAGYVDDVTVLAAHRRPAPTDPLRMTVPARAEDLLTLRAALTGWLEGLGASRDDVLALALAAWEAATNVADHAYPADRPGPLRLEAVLDGRGNGRVAIADEGRWTGHAQPSALERGRGIALMRSLADDLDLHRGPGGTTVTIHRSLTHPTVIGAPGAPLHEPASTSPFEAAITHRDPTVLRVSGPLDATTVDPMRAALVRERVGTQPLVLELSPVTFLASAGVQMLYELCQTHDALRLVAQAGSPAAHVLALTGLDHLVREPAAPARSDHGGAP